MRQAFVLVLWKEKSDGGGFFKRCLVQNDASLSSSSSSSVSVSIDCNALRSFSRLSSSWRLEIGKAIEGCNVFNCKTDKWVLLVLRQRENLTKWLSLVWVQVWDFLFFVTRLGDLQKFLTTKFPTKVSQIFGDYFEKHHFLCKIRCGNIWVNLGKFGLLFTPTPGLTGLSKLALFRLIVMTKKPLTWRDPRAPKRRCPREILATDPSSAWTLASASISEALRRPLFCLPEVLLVIADSRKEGNVL